jgi:hypothetical protein
VCGGVSSSSHFLLVLRAAEELAPESRNSARLDSHFLLCAYWPDSSSGARSLTSFLCSAWVSGKSAFELSEKTNNPKPKTAYQAQALASGLAACLVGDHIYEISTTPQFMEACGKIAAFVEGSPRVLDTSRLSPEESGQMYKASDIIPLRARSLVVLRRLS